MTRLKLSRDLPWFDGHFPGRPVLPGVAHLAMLEDLLRAERRAASGFARVRFRHEVFPDDETAIEVSDAPGAGAVRFTVRREGEIVADGLARVGPERPGRPGPATSALLPTLDPALPAIESLVPHRGAMRFIEGLVASTADATTALAYVSASSPFSRDGFAPAVLAIEIAAQAAAAGEALQRSRVTGVTAPREGRLVGASEVELLAAEIPLGHRLVVSVVLAHSVPPMAVYDATVGDGARVLATGKVNTYLI